MPLFSTVSLDDMRARGSIGEADVATLRRNFTNDGQVTVADAEALVALHRMAGAKPASWGDCFVELLTDHVVHQAEPDGYLTLEKAVWLVQQIAPDGAVASKVELEVIVNVLDKARWAPQSLIAFALEQVRRAVVEDAGPLRAGQSIGVGTISEAEVELLKRMLYAFGGDGTIAITRAEAELLFEIDAATKDVDNNPSWGDLFVKSIANCIMSASGYAAPSREQALAREAWVQKRKDDSATGILAHYKPQSPEQRAIAALERQKIEIVTGDEVTVADAQWLAERVARDGVLSRNEHALIELLCAQNPVLAPEFDTLFGRLQPAA